MKRMGRGRVSPELHAVEICKYMSWDYTVYIKQPSWFIDIINSKIKIDAEFSEIQSNKLKSKNG